jgi:tRNA 2-selenouridine synthase
MGNKIIVIEDLILIRNNHLLIDVRSPGEFDNGHIANAFSMPLFSNEERAIIGTLYKKEGRKKAMLEALNYYGINVKHIVEQVFERIKVNPQLNQTEVIVYCWRGGMRSSVVCWMLNLFGINTMQLKGGYKSYRRFVISQFDKDYPFIILGGKTGSAKTELLQDLANNNTQTINLEHLANLKVTQEHFDNLLAEALIACKPDKPIWIEDESQRIGDINIPNHIWNQMRQAEVYYLDIPVNARLKKIMHDYGLFDIELLVQSTLRLRKRLGGLDTQNCIKYLYEGNLEEAFRILLNYYDKAYQKSTARRESHKVIIIPSSTVDAKENSKLINHAFNKRNNTTYSI